MRPALIPLAVIVLAAALAFGVWLGLRGGDEPVAVVSAPPPTASPTVDPSLTFEDLIARAQPDPQGDVAVSVSESELTTAANNALPADAPVDRVDLELARADGAPVVRFSTELGDGGLDVSGTLALDLVDGRVRPELDDVRAGPFPVPAALRGPVDEVVAEARRFFTALDERGIRVTDLQVRADQLQVAGEVVGV